MPRSTTSILGNFPRTNTVDDDPLIVPQDSQHTSVENALRLMIKDKYSFSAPVEDIQEGVIARVITNPKQFEYSQKYELETTDQNLVPIRYKVYLLGTVGEMHPRPESWEDISISILDDYSKSPSFEGLLSVGQTVIVNIKKRTIEYSYDSKVITSATSVEKQSTLPNKKEVFNMPQQPANKNNNPVTVNNIPEDIIEDIAYSKGKQIGKIKLKTIVSYSSQRLREDAADKFNQMSKDAAQQQIRIVASSGFRQQQKQIELYNQRYEIPYPTRPKENGNRLSALGRQNGVAAYPGTSNHQSGIAVDIDVGSYGDQKNRYDTAVKNQAYNWLVENASKYGFNNVEGKSVNEPWHWVYQEVQLTDKGD